MSRTQTTSCLPSSIDYHSLRSSALHAHMLQLKQISKVLSQGLNPVSTTNTSVPLAISLLSSAGLPLTTVTSINSEETLASDNLKIYSLLAVSNFQQLKTKDWSLLEFEADVKAIIEQVHYSESKDQESVLYVVIFYGTNFLDAVAKLKIDNINSALQQGLNGYTRE